MKLRLWTIGQSDSNRPRADPGYPAINELGIHQSIH